VYLFLNNIYIYIHKKTSFAFLLNTILLYYAKMEQKENNSQSSVNEQSELEKYKKNLHSNNF